MRMTLRSEMLDSPHFIGDFVRSDKREQDSCSISRMPYFALRLDINVSSALSWSSRDGPLVRLLIVTPSVDVGFGGMIDL